MVLLSTDLLKAIHKLLNLTNKILGWSNKVKMTFHINPDHPNLHGAK